MITSSHLQGTYGNGGGDIFGSGRRALPLDGRGNHFQDLHRHALLEAHTRGKSLWATGAQVVHLLKRLSVGCGRKCPLSMSRCATYTYRLNSVTQPRRRAWGKRAIPRQIRDVVCHIARGLGRDRELGRAVVHGAVSSKNGLGRRDIRRLPGA
jgi:hypothetical protein